MVAPGEAIVNTVEHSVHSILAPSKAHMWAHCAGALRMCKGIAGKTSIDAASGTCTHYISEQHLKGAATLESFKGKSLTFDGFTFVVDQDRIERARKYCDVIERESGLKEYEVRLDTSQVLGVPGQEGHSDTITMDQNMVVTKPDGRQYRGIISGHDLKDGAGLVYAKDNLQGLIYIATAMFEYDYLYPWEGARFCIHQPRMHHYDEWFYTREEIAQFVVAIRPMAKLAWDLYNDVIELDEDKHLNPGFEQCHWCDVRGSCRKRTRSMLERFGSIDLTERLKLDDAEVAAHYATLADIEDWTRAIRAEAFRRAAQRRGAVAGFKVVRGKAGAREWTDESKAKSAILFALPPELPDEAVFKPRELQSPTAVQKLVGKRVYDIAVKDLVRQPPGQLALVPVTDRREEVILQRAEFEAIASLDIDEPSPDSVDSDDLI